MIKNSLIILSFALFSESAHSAEKPRAKWGLISVSNTALRTRPNFLSPKIVSVEYGSKVHILRKGSAWVEVETKGRKGWVHRSALQGGNNILNEIGKSDAKDITTYENEVVTAGKGFSPEYEDMMKKENSKLDYDELNKIEQREFSEEQLFKFAKEVGINSEVLK